MYPQLAAGNYTPWGDEVTPVATVTIHGGRVTTAWWPGHSRWPPGDYADQRVITRARAGR